MEIKQMIKNVWKNRNLSWNYGNGSFIIRDTLRDSKRNLRKHFLVGKRKTGYNI